MLRHAKKDHEMLNGHKVVAFTPYGREVTVGILRAYMDRDHRAGLLDEWWLCMNTDPVGQDRDIEYAHELARDHPWIKLKELPGDVEVKSPKQLNTGSFYTYMVEPKTVYLRFDDDIVYVHDRAIERMVTAKVNRKNVLGVFPIIWNNAVCSWHLQTRGAIPIGDGFRRVGDAYCMDAVGWADGEFAERIHRLLLKRIADGQVEKCFMYQDVQLAPRQQFSVSCFAVHSDDYRALEPAGVLDYYEEEHWLTVHRPEVVSKSNIILGDALVSHYTFYPQRNYIASTNILAQYRSLAMDLETNME